MDQDSNKICPNCYKEYDGRFDFCPHCGQPKIIADLSIKYFLTEFLSANFNVDSKIYRTFKLLIFYPSKITREFFLGKRVRYIAPVRLYLLVSLVYFFVLSISIENQHDSIVVDPKIDNNQLSDSIVLSTEDVNQALFEMERNADSADIAEHKLISFIKKLNSEQGQIEFKQLLKEYTSIGMFILIPLTALLFFILFRPNTYYIHHLIFTIHLQSIVFVIFTIFNLIEFIIDSNYFTYLELGLLITTIIMWIKSYYKRSFVKTMVKFVLFTLMYSFLLLLFFIVIFGISFLTL